MTTEREADVYWRSLLFVPANNARYAAKARTSFADGIIIDLEDAVLPEHKTEARGAVRRLAAELRTSTRDVLVRINRPLTLAVRDIEEAVCEDVKAIVVAKAASADHLSLLSEIIEEREVALGLPFGHTKLLPLIETADAVSRLDEIASFPRVAALVCGDEDLAADLGCEPASETLVAVKYRLVLAAALRGIRPLGLLGSIAEFRDIETYGSYIARSNAAGLKGTLCIHPSQIGIANKGFAPSHEQLEYARRVVEAAEVARRDGAGAVGLDGKMIDAPVLRRAENLLKAGSLYLGT
jgi:citrate lyase subunit beta/citryl-CoA lyase